MLYLLDLSAVETKVPARGKALVPTDLSIAIPDGTYARIGIISTPHIVISDICFDLVMFMLWGVRRNESKRVPHHHLFSPLQLLGPD